MDYLDLKIFTSSSPLIYNIPAIYSDDYYVSFWVFWTSLVADDGFIKVKFDDYMTVWVGNNGSDICAVCATNTRLNNGILDQTSSFSNLYNSQSSIPKLQILKTNVINLAPPDSNSWFNVQCGYSNNSKNSYLKIKYVKNGQEYSNTNYNSNLSLGQSILNQDFDYMNHNYNPSDSLTLTINNSLVYPNIYLKNLLIFTDLLSPDSDVQYLY